MRALDAAREQSPVTVKATSSLLVAGILEVDLIGADGEVIASVRVNSDGEVIQ
jgi:hypothetical protein